MKWRRRRTVKQRGKIPNRLWCQLRCSWDHVIRNVPKNYLCYLYPIKLIPALQPGQISRSGGGIVGEGTPYHLAFREPRSVERWQCQGRTMAVRLRVESSWRNTPAPCCSNHINRGRQKSFSAFSREFNAPNEQVGIFGYKACF